MVIILGECTGTTARKMEALGWGRMWIARGRNIYTYPGEPWGFDNGAFRDWRAGIAFDETAYMKSLEKAEANAEPPYLAVLPDIPTQGLQSLDYSMGWLGRLPDFNWYLAVQDGMSTTDVSADGLSGIFLGGTNSYKSTAAEWCKWAHAHGLKFHYGRAGTQSKVAQAQYIGADSLDSAFPMWTKQRFNDFTRWIMFGADQSDLFMNEVAPQLEVGDAEGD